MKHLLITTIAAVVLVGCGKSQQSTPPAEAKPVEPVAENTKPEPTTVKPERPQANRALIEATATGTVEAIKKAIDDGADVNAKSKPGDTPLDFATHPDNPNASAETADLLRKHGGKTGEELKAEGK